MSKITFTQAAFDMQTRCAMILADGTLHNDNGLCSAISHHYSAGIDNEGFDYYPVMKHLIGTNLYANYLGEKRELTNQRKAVCEKIVSMSIRTLRRYIAESKNTWKDNNPPVRAFAFIAKIKND